jgi:hypothetical protein
MAAAMGAAVVRRLHAAQAQAQPPRLTKLALRAPKFVSSFPSQKQLHCSNPLFNVAATCW